MKTRRVFIDTEFDSFGGRLISIAVVGDQGEEYYGVVADTAVNPWVQEHVIPKLEQHPITLDQLREQIVSFLVWHFPECQLQVYADWPDDLAHFFSLLSEPNGVTRIVNPVVGIFTRPPVPPQPDNPHNALSDARALRKAFLG
jgi:hypothetical protein